MGNTVDLQKATYTSTVGAVELKTTRRDPEFSEKNSAVYYLRVLEIPTPRWSTLLAIHKGVPLPKDIPAAEQQRGRSSPIWYVPAKR